MVYISFGGEVMTRPIIERSWALGKEVVIPVCQKERGMIVPSLLYSFDELEPKTMGILEPISDKLREVDPQSIDLCLVPGIAFDYYGNRIGFGAGYYDRFLPLLKPTAPKVALAHSFQLTVSPLPTNPNDIPVDFIITEKGKETPLLKK